MTLISLANFPIRDQLHPLVLPKDGKAPENANMDCVFDSYAACLEQQTGLALVGDDIKDYVKSDSYIGAGNAAWLQGDVATHFGASIGAFQSSNDQHRLLSAIRDYLGQGVPSLVTIPSRWNSQPTLANYTPFAPWFSTHVCAVYAIEGSLDPSGECWLMNPWPEPYFVDGHRQKVTLGWLQTRLCYGAIWPVQAISKWRDLAAIPGWEDDGTQMRRKGGQFVIVRGFRKFALLHPELFAGVMADEEPLENERRVSPALSIQTLKYVTLIWTPDLGMRLMTNTLAA